MPSVRQRALAAEVAKTALTVADVLKQIEDMRAKIC